MQQRLSPARRQVLQWAAGLGHVVDVTVLHQIYQHHHVTEQQEQEQPDETTTSGANLDPPPSKNKAEEEKESQEQDEKEETDDETLEDILQALVQENYLEPRGTQLYRFTHDQIQRTAYELIPAGQKRNDFHWWIGHYLYQQIESGTLSRAKYLFLATDQLNRGRRASLTKRMNEKDRVWLMQLTYEAAQMAKDRHGLDLTGLFLDQAKEMVRHDVDWDASYDLVLDIYNSIVSLETARGRHPDGIAAVQLILQHAKQAQDTVLAYASRSKIRTSEMQFDLALADAKQALEFCGECLPATRPRVVARQLRQTKRLVEGKSEEELTALFDQQTEADHRKLLAMKTYMSASVCGWHSNRNLLHLCSLGLFRLALQSRQNQYTGIAFTAFGALVRDQEGDVE